VRQQFNKDMAESTTVGKSDVLIALLGLTGAGKTTFAQMASGDKTLKVGHSIYPCKTTPFTPSANLTGQ
jgi:hypothetical protein